MTGEDAAQLLLQSYTDICDGISFLMIVAIYNIGCEPDENVAHVHE